MTVAAYVSLVGLDLAGTPELGGGMGQVRAQVRVENEFTGIGTSAARHKTSSGWPQWFEGSGPTRLSLVVNAVEIDTNDPVARALKAAALPPTSKARYRVTVATGDVFEADWLVQGLVYEAQDSGVMRLDFTLMATGTVTYSVS